MTPQRLSAVAKFELAEALRSRLVVVILVLYGAGAALGAYVFTSALEAAERTARQSMSDRLSAHDLPDDLIRTRVVPELLERFVDDLDLARALSAIDPLALFYGFAALTLVPLLVLITSGGAHAYDLSTGATRFVLTRADRWEWSLGKLLGHAALLGVGLLVGALSTALVGWGHASFGVAGLGWLLSASLRGWLCGVSYLGLFCGIGLWARTPARATMVSVMALVMSWPLYSLLGSDWLGARLPGVALLTWLFPAKYKFMLWSPSLAASIAAAVALLTIGAAAFTLGQRTVIKGDV